MPLRDPLAIAAILALIVAGAEWLVRHTRLRHAGTALVSILLAAVLANLGVIPAGSTADAPVPLYDGIFGIVAPLSIFWLLLGVNLRSLRQAGGPMLGLFVLGAFGTAVGALLAAQWLGGADRLGAQHAALAGMFTGTYIGGSINFNAIALEYGVVREGALYTATVVADNIVTAMWMVFTLVLPRLVAPLFRGLPQAGAAASGGPVLGIAEDTESVHPVDLALVLGVGAGGVALSGALTAWLGRLGISIPSMLVLTVVAVVLAQVPAVARLRGTRAVGLFAVYVFLAVIGAFCDLRALASVGPLGLTLLGFALITVTVHGVVSVTGARLLRVDPTIAAIASQANVGGGTSALACARSLGREDLVLPAVLVGSVGNALGNFLGFWVVGVLGG